MDSLKEKGSLAVTEKAIGRETKGGGAIVGLDLFKLIASLLIITLHSVEYGASERDEFIKAVFTRFAVPFFFMTSGFFFSKGISAAESAKAYFIKYEKKLLKVYAVWTLIFLPQKVYSDYFRYDKDILDTVLITFRRIFLKGTATYWYILALIISVFIIYLFYKKGLMKTLLAISFFFFLTGLLYDGFREPLSQYGIFNLYFKAVYWIFGWSNNFLMTGCFYTVVGFMIFRSGKKLKPLSAAIIFAAATVLRSAEFFLADIEKVLFGTGYFATNSISFFPFPQAVAFFFLAYSLKVERLRRFSLSMRQMSSAIFYTHAFFLYQIIDPWLGADLALPFKVLLTLTMSLIFYAVIKLINNRHLNILING